MKRIKLLSLGLTINSYQEFIERLLVLAKTKKSHYACFANVHMLIEAYVDPGFADIVRNAALVAPDGKALCWALRLLYGIKQERVAGMDVLPEMLQRAEENKISVFFYGNSEKTLNLTKIFLKNNYPDLIIAGFISPPFRPLSAEEEKVNLLKIRASGAELVFVCLGCPKQEKWMASNFGKIDALMLGIGGALAVMIGTKKRAPIWIQNFGMEWLFRLMQEPMRLFRRYASTNPIFLYLLCKEFIRTRIFPKFSRLFST